MTEADWALRITKAFRERDLRVKMDFVEWLAGMYATDPRDGRFVIEGGHWPTRVVGSYLGACANCEEHIALSPESKAIRAASSPDLYRTVCPVCTRVLAGVAP